jgi:hypothetical protein
MDRFDDVAVWTLLSYCDQSISCDVDANICKQAIRTRRDFRRSAARDLLVDLIVAEIDEIHDVVTDSIGAPAVTIDLRSDVEWGWRNVSYRAVGGSGHDDVAALLEWSSLDPVDNVAVNSRLR